MTLRTRITVIAAVAVALAVLVASLGLYVATARTLRTSIDRSLADIAANELPSTIDRSFRSGPRVDPYGGAGGTVQVVSARGITATPVPAGAAVVPLPVSSRTVAVATGTEPAFFETVTIDDEPVRILTVPAGGDLAVQLARPLTEVEGVLETLRRQLLVASLAGIGLAAALGAVVARRAVRPVGDLTRLAEEVAATQDLSRRLHLGQSTDEIGRLATAFDRMLAQIEQARTAQEQLVADASHELRTPLTSLRTNIEVLAEPDRLDPADRHRLVEDVVVQIDEFATMVADLVELARGETPVTTMETVHLDDVMDRILDRLDPGRDRIRATLHRSPVRGDAVRLERAMTNLVENALKYGDDAPVEVTVAPGIVHVRDHGPGIDPDDLPHVFERFYRSRGARGAPGSGLGLAIVQQIAAAHDGDVEVTNAPDGGVSATLRLHGLDGGVPAGRWRKPASGTHQAP